MADGLLGFDPAMFQQYAQMFAPSEEEKRQARGMAALAAAAGLLGTRRGQEMQGLSQGLLGGLGAYQNDLRNVGQQRLQGIQGASAMMQLAQQQQQMQRQQKMDQIAGQFQRPEMGPPGPDGQMQPGGYDYQGYGNALAGIDPMRALQFQQSMRKEQPEVKEIRSQTDQSGNPVDVIYFKDGTSKVVPYGTARKMVQVPLGGSVAFVDESRVPNGASLQKTPTPGEIMSRDTAVRGQDLSASTATRGQDLSAKTAREGQQITMRGQNMADTRSRESNQIAAGNRQQQGIIELRKEFNGLDEVKNYKSVLPIINSAKNAPDTPAGDIDVIYAVGKIMDPGSVVREGELNLVINSGSPAQRLMGYVNRIRGGGRLTSDQRKQLMQVLDSRVGGLESGYKSARSTMERAAKAQGLPPDQIFIEPATSNGKGPSVGTVVQGYRFKGGDPNDKKNWERQ